MSEVRTRTKPQVTKTRTRTEAKTSTTKSQTKAKSVPKIRTAERHDMIMDRNAVS